MKPFQSTSAVLYPPCFVSLAIQSPSVVSCQGLNGPPKFLYASLCTCHSLMTPEILHILTHADASVLTSVYVKTLVDLDLHFEAVPTFRSCELPTACTILCVRFTLFVHLLKFKKKNLRFRRGRNTQYGWVVNPFPTGTLTLQNAPSFAWRSNAYITGKMAYDRFLGRAPFLSVLM